MVTVASASGAVKVAYERQIVPLLPSKLTWTSLSVALPVMLSLKSTLMGVWPSLAPFNRSPLTVAKMRWTLCMALLIPSVSKTENSSNGGGKTIKLQPAAKLSLLGIGKPSIFLDEYSRQGSRRHAFSRSSVCSSSICGTWSLCQTLSYPLPSLNMLMSFDSKSCEVHVSFG